MMNFFSLLIFLSITTLTYSDQHKCGDVKVNKITALSFNATESYAGQWPWLASLFLKPDRFLCGSSIITQWHLLTAAHCVITNKFEDFYALLGRFDISNANEVYWQRRNVSGVSIHQIYNSAAKRQISKGDIAIFKVSQEISYTDYIQPVCLPTSSSRFVGLSGAVAGYGQIDPIGYHQNTPSHVLLTSIDHWTCLEKGDNYHKVVSEYAFCGGNREAIPCKGDSGGGYYVYNRATHQFTTYGIVSHGIGNCNPRENVVFTDVRKFMPWINEEIGLTHQCRSISCDRGEKCAISMEGQPECVCQPEHSGLNCLKNCSTDADCPDDLACDNNSCDDICSFFGEFLNCGENAECIVTNHQAKCECISGYSGNENIGCELNSNFLIGEIVKNYRFGHLEGEIFQHLKFYDDNTRNSTNEVIKIAPKYYNENVTILDIQSFPNHLNFLPIKVDAVFPNLKWYSVQNEALKKIKRENFVNMSKLEMFKILGNYYYNDEMIIEKNTFDDLTELTSLEMHGCKIENLPKNVFANNRKLKRIYLYSNKIKSLSSDIFENLGSLREIELQSNQLTSLPENIFSTNSELTKIYLGGNKISSLYPAIFENLRKLKFIELQENQLTSLDENIFRNQVDLEIVHVFQNQLTSLPESIFSRNRKLTEIGLNSNKISFLRSGIFENLPELKKIWLYENELTSVPENTFHGNSKLEKISLHSNKITSLSSATFQNLGKLKLLELTNNELTSLPENIFENLVELEILQLNNNQLTSLPANIFSRNSKLFKIDLTMNKISSLHSSIFQSLPDLISIFLFHNELSTLPENIFHANKKIRIIDLFRNKITTLSSTIFENKPNLRSVSLYSNICINKFYGDLYDNQIMSNEERKSLSDDLKQNC